MSVLSISFTAEAHLLQHLAGLFTALNESVLDRLSLGEILAL